MQPAACRAVLCPVTGLRRVSSCFAVLIAGLVALPACGGGRDENAESFGSFGPGAESDTDTATGPTATVGGTDANTASAADTNPSSGAEDSGVDTESETAGLTGGLTDSDSDTDGESTDTESVSYTHLTLPTTPYV